MLKIDSPLYLIKIISSYLEHRTYSVRVNGHSSSTRKILAGIPQGSCLSPILFTIYINDIPLLPGVQVNLFADDTMFFATSMGSQHAVNKVQTQIHHVLPWLHKWKLTLNACKTEAIKFGRHFKNTEQLEIHGNLIPWRNNIKYLGLRLDKNLSFNMHTNAIATKARGVRAAFYPILSPSSPLSIKTKIAIYKLYIRSQITYAGPAWGAHLSATNWKKLEAIQNIAIRTISNSPWFVRNETIQKSLNIPTLREAIRVAAKRMFEKTERSTYPHLQNIGKALGPPNDSDRAPGRSLTSQPH